MSINVPQLASSELSWQSLSPSQMYAGFVQIPVPHWNWPGLHLKSAVGRNRYKCALMTHGFGCENVPPTIYTITHGSRQARRTGLRSRPQCHTSTRTGYTCHSCTQTEERCHSRYIFQMRNAVLFCLGLGLTSLMIMPSPGWRCSSTCTVSHQRPGRSYLDRHIYSHHPETADTSYCSRHCLSDMGDLWLTGEKRTQHYRQGRH